MAAASGSILQRCIVSPAGRHSASLIFLHGSGDSGRGLRMWIKQVLNQDLTFQHIKIIYPTAPPRSYTPMKGGISNVWFDRFKISNDCPEHLESIDVMCQVLTDLIDDEVKSGIKKNRILIEMTRVDKPGSIPNNKRKSFNKSPLNMLLPLKWKICWRKLIKCLIHFLLIQSSVFHGEQSETEAPDCGVQEPPELLPYLSLIMT
ncbi:lysophospholipase-like protein 1 isoform X2 [Aotus nancymaae]|uniref:lysophospholipase-like protein 1 isoform X2 n=1 Tax=Aotus nancymaae TaxID=37293 RepID=UPI0030FEB329